MRGVDFLHQANSHSPELAHNELRSLSGLLELLDDDLSAFGCIGEPIAHYTAQRLA